MSEGPQFLTLPDWEDFNKPDRCVPRAVLLPRDPRVLNFSNQPQDFVQVLIEDLNKVGKLNNHGVRKVPHA